MSDVLTLTKENFRSVLETANKPLLVDFWAPWCGPCRMLTPEIEAVSKSMAGKVTVAKINIDEEPELAEAYGVQSIPNMIVFKNGKPIRQMVGFMDRDRLIAELT